MRSESKLVVVKCLVFLGFAFIAFGFTLGIATYVWPGWYTYSVATTINDQWDYTNRTRGIFQECTVNKGLTVTPSGIYIKKNDCFENDIGQYPITNSKTNNEQSFWTIIRFRLSQLILHGISLVFAFVMLLVGIGIVLRWFSTNIDSTYYIKWRLAFGLISLLLFFVMVCSPVLGTALVYIENFENSKTIYLPHIQIQNPNILFSYGYMYQLAWVSAGFYLVAALLFLISVCLGSNLEEQKYKPQVISVDNPAFITEDGKNMPIFLAPSTGSTFGPTYEKATPNDAKSPGLLPRYNIN